MEEVLSEVARLGLRWGLPDGSMVSREAVVAEARTWIGTPFMHQQEKKGVGVDCGGIVRGVSVALGLIPANYRDLVPIRLHGYSRQPDGNLGQQLCDMYWRRIDKEQLRPGDVVLIRWISVLFPQHTAFVGNYVHGGLTLIHAVVDHPSKVVEHRIDNIWRSRIETAYQLPGVS